MKCLLVLLLGVLATLAVQAQESGDTLRVAAAESARVADSLPSGKRPYRPWRHQADWPRPRMAVQLGFVPGLGQIYNRQLWKLPLVYGALGGCSYFAVINHREYVRYRTAYRLRMDGDSTTIDEFDGLIFNPQSLQTLRNQYQQNRDLSIVLGVLAYLGMLMDAYVSAHLTHFKVSDDLSLQVLPPVWLADRRGLSGGLVLTFR